MTRAMSGDPAPSSATAERPGTSVLETPSVAQPEALPHATDAALPTGGPASRGIARHVAARLVFWMPVFAALGLFAQVAFLGLRPAISEARRLADASDMLEGRWRRDQQLYDAYELQVQARKDPIFRERQRRARLASGPAGG